MMQTDFMDSLFFESDLKIIDLKKGLTNQNFLLDLRGEQYVLRVPREDANHIVNRHHETLALQAIQDADIDVDMIYFDEASGYKVTRYLPDALTYEECPLEHKIELVASLMKKFHGLHVSIQESFDPVKRVQEYQKRISTPLFDLQPYQWIESSISHLNHTPTLCHNDWVDGNMLFVNERVYLIDYEYAADNDPLFDVMSFLTENQINDPMLRKRFYEVYFDSYDESTLQDLRLWEDFHNYLWCHWAMMMYESRQEEVYRLIATDKFNALKKR